VPIAIASNAIRITGAGIMADRFGPAAAEGFLHAFSGWSIFVTALILMFGCHGILRHIGKRREDPARV
jgi:exosortase/archaeosortase family protein